MEDILVLKNNKGTEDNRVRKLDYSIQLNRTMYERFLKDEDITLFSPHDVPGLYEAYFGDPDVFQELYEKYERSTKIKKKKVPAMELFGNLLKERAETGRIYIMNVDHANTHSSFKDPVYMSNLCLAGNTPVKAIINDAECTVSLDELDAEYTKGSKIKVLSFNLETNAAEYKKVTASAMMSSNAKVMEITDDVSGQTIVCTPEHKIYTKNKGYVMAKDLTENDELGYIKF
jgi:ribonucleotide reductase alpha subunit